MGNGPIWDTLSLISRSNKVLGSLIIAGSDWLSKCILDTCKKWSIALNGKLSSSNEWKQSATKFEIELICRRLF